VQVSYRDSGYEPNPASRVFRNKYGDCKDKATLLISMLNALGVPAFYAILPTNRAPELVKDIPFLYQFDHCIVAIREGDRYLYIDPVEFNRYGNLPSMDQGRDILVFEDGTFRFGKTGKDASKVVSHISIELEKDGHIQGVLKNRLYGDYDTDIRSEFVNLTQEEYKEFENAFVSGYHGIKVLNSRYSDPFDLKNPLSMQLDFEAKDYGQKLGDLWILPNRQFSIPEFEAFTQEKRVHSLKFDEISEQRCHLEIRIPQGYEIYYIPEDFEHHDRYYDIVSVYSKSDGAVKWDYSFNRKAVLIPKEDYSLLREKFQDLVRHSQKQIILKKM
jgi:hypothetical protein